MLGPSPTVRVLYGPGGGGRRDPRGLHTSLLFRYGFVSPPPPLFESRLVHNKTPHILQV